MKPFLTLQSVETVIEHLRTFSVLQEELAPLDEALGRHLSQAFAAPADLPGFDRSTVDGYAVRARDVFGAQEGSPALVHCVGDCPMGAAPEIVLQEGQAARISPTAIKGYRDEEYTHMNVAAAVLSGRADAGLAVRAAANALGLPFVPVGVEEYDLVIPQRFFALQAMQALLQVIRSKVFRETVAGMGGYGTEKTGQVVWEYAGK